MLDSGLLYKWMALNRVVSVLYPRATFLGLHGGLLYRCTSFSMIGSMSQPPDSPDVLASIFRNPITLMSLWPDVRFGTKQKEIVESITNNDTVFVYAAHGVGKDFIAAYIVLTYFLFPWLYHPACPHQSSQVRIILTSVRQQHLNILWGELIRFIHGCVWPISKTLLVRSYLVRKLIAKQLCPVSYITGIVTHKHEFIAGHHAPYTLCVLDEASGIENGVYERIQTWAKKVLVLGNPYPTHNFYQRLYDVPDDPGKFVKIVYPAHLSPNIYDQGLGVKPIPGLITYDQYQYRLHNWPAILVEVGLHAKFPNDRLSRLYPNELVLRNLVSQPVSPQPPLVLGVDPGEGVSYTAYTLIQPSGIVVQHAEKTSDTSQIIDRILYYIRYYSLQPNHVVLDRGGGGKVIADVLRKKGYDVVTMSFGERPTPRELSQESDWEERYEYSSAYKNRRIMMYLELRKAMEEGFAIPNFCSALLEQLAKIPVLYDEEGRLYLPPKHSKREGALSLYQILGRSPDELDSLVLAVYYLRKRILVYGQGVSLI